jgi:hypothetical protein
MLRHRDAWAVEARAPSKAQWEREQAEAAAPSPERGGAEEAARRRIVRAEPAPAARGGVPKEILVVVSRLKAYVQARTGMNTSDAVMPLLSDLLREVADEAAANARRDGRKTILERDLPRWDLR